MQDLCSSFFGFCQQCLDLGLGVWGSLQGLSGAPLELHPSFPNFVTWSVVECGLQLGAAVGYDPDPTVHFVTLQALKREEYNPNQNCDS